MNAESGKPRILGEIQVKHEGNERHERGERGFKVVRWGERP